MTHGIANAEARQALDRLTRGFQISRMLRLVADIGLADRIPPGQPRSLDELARECGAQREPLLRVLRALASSGVFVVGDDDTVAHTPMSMFLRTDVAGSLHHGARFWTAPGSWRAWGELDVALRGESPHMAAWGVGRFDYLRSHPDEARIFDRFMASFPDDRHQALAEACDLADARVIMDVGGGNGECLRRILARFEKPVGMLCDRPDVLAAVPDSARAGGRITLCPADVLEGVPSGADVVILMRVLHDFADEAARTILHNCRKAVQPGARLLICEQLLDPDPARGDPLTYLIDTQMMAMFGAGRERTEAEFKALLDATGFAWQRTLPTKAQVVVVEALAR